MGQKKGPRVEGICKRMTTIMDYRFHAGLRQKWRFGEWKREC